MVMRFEYNIKIHRVELDASNLKTSSLFPTMSRSSVRVKWNLVLFSNIVRGQNYTVCLGLNNVDT